MTLKSAGVVQLTGRRVLGFEHLGVLVVGHRLRRRRCHRQERLHVELLLDQRDVLGRIEADLGQRSEDLELVAETPVPDLLTLEVGRRR